MAPIVGRIELARQRPLGEYGSNLCDGRSLFKRSGYRFAWRKRAKTKSTASVV